jgi:hypothetical protein
MGFEPTTSGLGGLRAIHTALRAHDQSMGCQFRFLGVSPDHVSDTLVTISADIEFNSDKDATRVKV